MFVGFFACKGECVNFNDESVNFKKILLFDINQLKQESFGIAKLLYVALPGFQHFDLNHGKCYHSNQFAFFHDKEHDDIERQYPRVFGQSQEYFSKCLIRSSGLSRLFVDQQIGPHPFPAEFSSDRAAFPVRTHDSLRSPPSRLCPRSSWQ